MSRLENSKIQHNLEKQYKLVNYESVINVKLIKKKNNTKMLLLFKTIQYKGIHILISENYCFVVTKMTNTQEIRQQHRSW